MRLPGSWLSAICAGAVLALPAPALAHQQISLELEELNAAISQSPGSADLYVDRGELYRLNREWALAEADFRRALELAPDDPDVNFHLGRLWFEAGDLARSRRALDQFLAAFPGHVEGLLVRGRVLGALGDRLAAVADYDLVIARLDPPQPEHYLQRAQWLAAEGGAHVDAALGGIDEAIARLGPVVTLIEFAIDTELRRTRYEAVLERFSSLPAMVVRQPYWMARRGDVLHAAGHDREASIAYAEALAAIESLPAKRRTIAATVTLEGRLRRLKVQNGSND